ncbi:hypothetical protein MTBPR1_220012 [Candidatus Terasakiella magnetica]|uniref:Uncharacterized protein n=1 Tax=Candidatus Terasakiella magnetica TaxID=1867952 RepID=A0A1C3RH42_9PROT|nr:hypothetical protein MTBPR1_220012 [Candidatus Terasakiella magnetica]
MEIQNQYLAETELIPTWDYVAARLTEGKVPNLSGEVKEWNAGTLRTQASRGTFDEEE